MQTDLVLDRLTDLTGPIEQMERALRRTRSRRHTDVTPEATVLVEKAAQTVRDYVDNYDSAYLLRDLDLDWDSLIDATMRATDGEPGARAALVLYGQIFGITAETRDVIGQILDLRYDHDGRIAVLGGAA